MTSVNVISVVRSRTIEVSSADINLMLNYVFSSQ